MAVSIDDFLSEVSSGGGMAMGNMFRVQLPPINDNAREMTILCTRCDLPGRQITTTDSRSGTEVEKVAYGYLVSDVSMSFYILNDYKTRSYFEEWQNLAFNQETQTIGYHSDYTKDVVIQQLKKGVAFPIAKKKLFDAGKIPSSIRGRLPRLGPLDFAQGEFDLNALLPEDVVYECKLINAFPTSMNVLPLATGEGGLMEVTVQLSYKNWESKNFKTRGSQLGEALLGGILRKIF